MPSGESYKTASNELIQDEGPLKVKAEDQYGQLRAIPGKILPVHKPLASAGQFADAGHYGWLTDKGGWIIPGSAAASRTIDKVLAKEAKKANHKMLPVYKEKGVYNFYVKIGERGGVSAIEAKQPEEMSKNELVAKVKALEERLAGFRRPPQA